MTTQRESDGVLYQIWSGAVFSVGLLLFVLPWVGYQPMHEVAKLSPVVAWLFFSRASWLVYVVAVVAVPLASPRSKRKRSWTIAGLSLAQIAIGLVLLVSS